jgi:hypothetical protein
MRRVGLPDVGDGQGDDGRQASADADELQAKLGSAHKLGIGSYKTAWLIPAQAAQEHGASRWKKTVEVVEIAHRTKDDALGCGQGRRHFGKIFRRRECPSRAGRTQSAISRRTSSRWPLLTDGLASYQGKSVPCSSDFNSLFRRVGNFSANTLILLQPG